MKSLKLRKLQNEIFICVVCGGQTYNKNFKCSKCSFSIFNKKIGTLKYQRQFKLKEYNSKDYNSKGGGKMAFSEEFCGWNKYSSTKESILFEIDAQTINACVEKLRTIPEDKKHSVFFSCPTKQVLRMHNNEIKGAKHSLIIDGDK